MAAAWPYLADFRVKHAPAWYRAAKRHVDNCVAAQHGTLLLWLPLAMMAGIGLHFQLPWLGQRELAMALIAGAMVPCAMIWLISENAWRARAATVLAALMLIGVAVAAQRETQVAAPVMPFPQSVTLTAEVLDIAGDKLYLRPLAADRPLPQLRVVRILLRGSASGPQPVPGDEVQMRVRLTPPAGPVSPGGYDFSRVAWFKQIGATGIAFGPPVIRRHAQPSSLIGQFNKLREQSARRFKSQLAGDTGTVAAALVVGERGDISPEVTQELRVSGLAHLLSVSGFHLVMVAGGLFWGARHLLALSRRVALHWPVKAIAAGVSVLGALAYTLLTGAAYPTQRALIGLAIAMVALLIGRSAISLRVLALVTLALLALRPEALLDASFQLSFTGVAALLACYESPRIQAWFRSGAHTHLLRRMLLWLANTMLATLVAELALAPIAIGQFHQLGVYGILANAVAVPFTGFVLMPLGFLALALQPLGLDGLVTPMLGGAIDLFLTLAHWAATLPHAQLKTPEIGTAAFTVLMSGMLVLIVGRHLLKAAGLLGIVAGIIMACRHTQPLVRVAPTGAVVAVQADGGELAFVSLRRGRFARKVWLEEQAQSNVRSWQDVAPGACAGDVCTVLLARAQNRLGYLASAAAPARCPAVDILVDMRAVRTRYCTAPIYIDRRFLRHNGAVQIHAVNRQLVLSTAADRQGDHRWAPRLQPYKKL